MIYDRNKYITKIDNNYQKIYLVNAKKQLYKIKLQLLYNIIKIDIKFNKDLFHFSLNKIDFLNNNNFKSKNIKEIYNIINNSLKNNISIIYINDMYLYLTIFLDVYNEIKFQFKKKYTNKNIIDKKILTIENENDNLKKDLYLIKIKVEELYKSYEFLKNNFNNFYKNNSFNIYKKIDLLFDNLNNYNFNKKYKNENIDIQKENFNWNDFKLNSNGLIPVITQDFFTENVLMLAYMNKEAYEKTIKTGKMTYWSRSRNELWIKGNTSGNYQYLKYLYIDCDKDTILAKVIQIGYPCHKGFFTCFFNEIMKI